MHWDRHTLGPSYIGTVMHWDRHAWGPSCTRPSILAYSDSLSVETHSKRCPSATVLQKESQRSSTLFRERTGSAIV
jgi:hypothetical protein